MAAHDTTVGGRVKAPRGRRLDVVLVERGLAESRARAQALVGKGMVYSGGRRLEKAGQWVGAEQMVEVRGRDHPWASRGGLKLAHGLDRFRIDVEGRVALDIGASTGGFTEVLLCRGAAKVYAVDVGHGQLHPRLREHPRVVVLERCNARALSRRQVPEPVDVIVCDVSFIGLETVLPAPLGLAAREAAVVALIKPQFEVGPGRVGKGGVVRDAKLRAEVCDRLETWLEGREGWAVLGLAKSPVKGAAGNTEFIIAARRSAPQPAGRDEPPRTVQATASTTRGRSMSATAQGRGRI